MCGILGSINLYFDNCHLDQLKHRGPDDYGQEEFKVGRNHIRLGQRRLSIIDLSPAGHQPMFTQGLKCCIIFNGEVYNHQELRKRLPQNIIFKGHSDTETILYYLKEFGVDGIKDFNGIFSFAFLDLRTNRLILARDPFGVKPLYYHHGDSGRFVFSSEIRPIRALLSENSLNYEALASLLRLRFNPSPDTINAQIKKVPPGHFFEIDLNNDNPDVKKQSYVSAVPKTIQYRRSEIVTKYGEKLEEAVKRQLLSDVEVGILLSGGIDSALVAALAQKHYEGRLKAFTIGFEGEYQEDEISDAVETAEFLGLEHYYKKISFTDFLTKIKDCSKIVEEPLATTSTIPMYFLSELASEKVKVVLTGQGADEPLGGYTRYKSELILNRIPRLLQRILIPILKTGRFKDEKILRGVNVLGSKNDTERFLLSYEVFSTREIHRLVGVTDRLSLQRIDYLYDLLGCINKKHPVERMMALDARLNLSDDLLNYTDKITMNFSIECRVPMLDLELVRFIESLPVNYKVSLTKGKLIHKQFAGRILPDRIIKRKKRGFKSPTNSWFQTNSDIIRELLLSRNSCFSKVFNQDYVEEIIKQHSAGFNREKQIFLLLNIYFSLESFEREVALA